MHNMILGLVYALLACAMSGAVPEDPDACIRFMHPRTLTTTETESLLERHFGPYYNDIQEGHFEQYWERVWNDVQTNIFSFEEGLAYLKHRMAFSWQDVHARMPWVQNVYEDLIKPLERLCDGEGPLTFRPFFGEEYRKQSEGKMLKNLQLLREYWILSDVATYVSLDCPNNLSQEPLDFLKGCIKNFRSKTIFMNFCTLFLLSDFSRGGGSIASDKASLRSNLYGLCSIECSSSGITGKGLCTPTGEILMPEYFAALKKHMRLYGMPYMEKGVERLQDGNAWLEGSESIFVRDLFLSNQFNQFVVLWSKLYPSEAYPLAYMLEEMQSQMQAEQENPVEMLQIMMTFFSALNQTSCEHLVVSSAEELIHSLKRVNIIALSKDWEDLIHTFYGNNITEENALQYVNACYQEYFIKGIHSIINKYAWNHSLLQAYYMTSTTNVWDSLDSVAKQYNGHGFLEKVLLRMYAGQTHQINQDKRGWVELLRAFLTKDSIFVRYILWDEPMPFVRWSDVLKVLVVCFPNKGCVLPQVVEMQSLRGHHPLTDAMHYCSVGKLISYIATNGSHYHLHQFLVLCSGPRVSKGLLWSRWVVLGVFSQL